MIWFNLPARYFTKGRPGNPTLVVIHSTEGDTAGGAARWFQNVNAGGSAHVVVDDAEVYRCVDDADTAWHAIGFNSIGLGLEIAGHASWNRDEWLDHMPRLTEAARIHAGWCKAYDIPLVESTTRGYHSHKGLPGNDHTDPGTGFPWDVYLDLVKGFLSDETKPEPLPYGGSLRLSITPAIAGKTVTAGWDESAGPLKWIAKNGLKPDTKAAIAWRGNVWRGPVAVSNVAKHLVAKYLTPKENA